MVWIFVSLCFVICYFVIVTYYPDFGVEKWKLLFNQTVEPRPPLPSVSKLHILFCYDGDVLCRDFHHNHYVPLIFGLLNASVKRKTLQSSKKSKKTCLPIDVKHRVQSKLSFTPSTLITKTEHVPIAPKLSSAVLPNQSSSFFNFYRKSSISVSSAPSSTIPSSSSTIPSSSTISS